MNETPHRAELEALLSLDHRALVAMLGRRIPAAMRGVIAAEDVAQEAAMEAHRALGTFRPDGEGALRRWVWQIARHRLADLVKAHRRVKRGGSAAPSSGACALDAVASQAACPARSAGDREHVAAVRRAVAALPDTYRRAVELRFFEDLSIDEAAARLGRTPSATAVLCNRALKLLRREMTGAQNQPVAA